MDSEIKKLNEQAKKYSNLIEGILSELKKVIVGQEPILNKLMVGLIANGHILVEGVPGLAKTLMIKTLADTIHAKFQRIQFTPDILLIKNSEKSM